MILRENVSINVVLPSTIIVETKKAIKKQVSTSKELQYHENYY